MLKEFPMIKQISTNVGTSLIGYLPAWSTKKITNLVGFQPIRQKGLKTTIEWILMNEAGTCVTIYNYKGDRWHVGGGRGSVQLAQELFGDSFRKCS
jgi:hypothetical protein